MASYTFKFGHVIPSRNVSYVKILTSVMNKNINVLIEIFQ